jgi:hypothetical protein
MRNSSNNSSSSNLSSSRNRSMSLRKSSRMTWNFGTWQANCLLIDHPNSLHSLSNLVFRHPSSNLGSYHRRNRFKGWKSIIIIISALQAVVRCNLHEKILPKEHFLRNLVDENNCEEFNNIFSICFCVFYWFAHSRNLRVNFWRTHQSSWTRSSWLNLTWTYTSSIMFKETKISSSCQQRNSLASLMEFIALSSTIRV